MIEADAIRILNEVCYGSVDPEIVGPLLDRLSEAYQNTVFIDLIYHQKIELNPEQIIAAAKQCEANEAARLALPRKVIPTTKADALKIVKDICYGPGIPSVIKPLFERLSDAFPHADFKSLICHQEAELTPEDIVKEAMRREAEYARAGDKT